MKQTLAVLNALEAEGVLGRYAIGGAMGATFYLEPFTTLDLDIFVVLPEVDGFATLGPLYQALKRRGYEAHEECIVIEGLPVQILPAYNPLLEEALRQALESRYDGLPVRVFTPEHLVAVAVQTGRPKDRQRVQMFLDQGALELAVLEPLLARHGLTERWRQWTAATT
jgi:hypothetical protein